MQNSYIQPIKILALIATPQDSKDLELILRAKQIETIIVYNILDLKNKIGEEGFNLVLSETSDETSVLELFEIIKLSQKNLPVILWSDIELVPFVVKMMQLGARDYILKKDKNQLADAIFKINAKQEALLNNFQVSINEATRKMEDIQYALDQSSIVAATDNKGVITYVNDTFCEISGYTRQELLGKTHQIINSGHHDKKFMRSLWKTISAGKVWHGEIKNKNKNGLFYWVDTTIVPMLGQDGKPEKYVSIRNDITARKKAEEALELSQQSILELTIHNEREREKERARIAYDLHDDLGQSLTALNLGLGWLEHKLEEMTEVQNRIKTMKDIILNVISRIQTIATNLRPSVLDNFGLPEALEWQLKDFEANTDIKTKLYIQISGTFIHPDITILIFRIFQEALTNIARHAFATQTTVQLIENENTIILVVKDNGIGIPQEALQSYKTFGLNGMRERTKWGNGRIDINSFKNKGTEIIVEFPLK